MRIRELRRGAGGLEVEDDEDEPWEVVRGADGEVVSVERRNANRALVGAGARFLFYPTLLYNVIRNQLEPEFHWWDLIDEYVLLGAVPFCSDVPRLKQLGVRGVVTLNEPYETLVPKSLYQAQGISHLEIPTRDYLFAPSMENICEAVDFIHQNELQCGITYVHCKAGRGRSTTVVLCYLVKYRNMTPKAALDHARFVRPRVKLAKAQWQAVEEFSILTTIGCLSVQSLNLICSGKSGEESLADNEADGYTTKIDSEHFGSPMCQSMVSWPTSPSGCSDSEFITDADLEGYRNNADGDKDDASVEVVARHKLIMRKTPCRVLEDHQQLGTTSEPFC